VEESRFFNKEAFVSTPTSFDWKCQPVAERLILDGVERAIQMNPFIAQLDRDLLEKTSTRLFDWLDHVVFLHSPEIEKKLAEAGFVLQSGECSEGVYFHPGAQLPRVALSDVHPLGLAICVDQIADFLLVRGGLPGAIEGTPFGRYRKCLVDMSCGVNLWVVERRGTFSVQPIREEEGYLGRYFKAVEAYSNRKRCLPDEDRAMEEAHLSVRTLVDLVGIDLAATIVLEAERNYWQARNTAGQLQKNRQDKLGVGWANHDHHTFRSSRRHFVGLVKFFEALGFHCRERFYAGEEAGWGAQVMENPTCRLVLFLDVDLDPHEVQGDFAHEPLPELPRLGTIGLWCALHGDSILRAGMHHLEAQFMFDELTHDLDRSGVKMMQPFSFFPYLKQAFTVGEMWPVDDEILENLMLESKITREQAEKFRCKGALGSHLENLQRREGYKGFNQKNVSIIIKETDPRVQ
jgi:hypothetical protein